MNRNFSVKIFGILFVLVFSSLEASAQNPGFLPFQALITNTSDIPQTNYTIPANDFVIDVLDSTNLCVLYQEVFTSAVTTDGVGMTSLSIGQGGTYTYVPGLPAATIQSALTAPTVTVTGAGCLAGTAEAGSTPTSPITDGRSIQFSVTGTTGPWSAPVSVGSVPYAFNADNLGGVPATGYVQATGVVTQTAVANLLTSGFDASAAGYHNHDSRYALIGGSATQNFNAQSEDVTGQLKVGTGGFTAGVNLDIEEATPPVLRIGSTGTSGDQMALQFYAGNGVTNTASITSMDNSNTLSISTGGVTAMTVNPNQTVTFSNSVSASALALSAYLSLGKYATGSEPTPVPEGTMWENDSLHQLRFFDGTTNQTLVDSVTSTGNGITVGGTASAATLGLSYGILANTVMQGNQPLSGDVTGTVATTNVAKLQGYTLNLATPPGNAQVLTYSTGTSTWTAQNAPAGVPALTLGSVIFSGGGTTLSQDNTKFFWDDTNHRLGVDAGAAPGNTLSVNAPTTADASAQVMISNTATTNKALVLQEFAGQATNMMEVQTPAGGKVYTLEWTGTPTANTDLTNKSYVTTSIANAVANYVAVNGTTPLTASWNVGNQSIKNIAQLAVGTPAATNPLNINSATAPDAVAQALIATGAIGNSGLVVQGTAGQTANLVETQSSTGTVLAKVDSIGKLGLVNLAADPGSFTAADTGAVWYNTTSSQIKFYNGVSAQALGVAGSGILTLDGNGGNAQTLTAGANITVTDAGATHTIAVSGQIPLASGGTNATLAAANGGIVWSNATQMQISPVGTAKQVLASGGAGAPVWSTDMTVDNVNHLVTLDSGGTPAADGLVVSSLPFAGTGTSLVRLGTTDLSATSSALGTYIGANPAAVGPDFINYQVAGATKFLVDKNGDVNISANSPGTAPLVVRQPAAPAADMQDWYGNGTLFYSLNDTGTPTLGTDLVTRSYVATSITTAMGNYVATTGTTPLTGNWNVGGFQVNNILAADIGSNGAPLDPLSFGVAPPLSTSHALINLSNSLISAGSPNGTYIGANPAAAGADFINYQVGGGTKFKVDVNGIVTGNGTNLQNLNATNISSGILGIAEGGTGLNSTAQSFVFIGPSSGGGTPTFRALVPSDVPTLNQNTAGTASNVTGVVAVVNGGTGLNAVPAANQVLLGNGAGYTLTSSPTFSNLTLTGAELLPFGTATTPSLGVGTATTGLFGQAGGQLAFTTVGVERMRVNGTGVGIGTTTPAGTLDVEGGTAAAASNGNNINLVAQNGGTTSGNGGGINFTSGSALASNNNGGNFIFSVGTGTGSGTNGMVGIENSPYTPLSMLHLYGAPGTLMKSPGLATPTTSYGILRIEDDEAGILEFGQSYWDGWLQESYGGGPQNLVLQPMGGNVGIGITGATEPLSVSPIQYSTGTATQVGSIVTGVGTAWTAAMVGSYFSFADGQSAGTITAVGSSTSMTVTSNQTIIPAQAYTVNYPGLNVNTTGAVAIGTTTSAYNLDVVGSSDVARFGSSSSGYVKLNAPAGDYLQLDFQTGGADRWHVGPAPTTPNFGIFNFADGIDDIYIVQTGANQDDVGIGGNMTPAYPLDVTGDIRTSGCLHYASSTLGTCASDRRLKKNIENYDLGLGAVKDLQPVTYQYNGLGGQPNDGKTQIGLIAQMVEKVAPALIKKQKVKMHPDDKDMTEIKAVDYGALTYMLINSVKELYAKITRTDERVEALEKENAALKAQNEEILRRLAAIEQTTSVRAPSSESPPGSSAKHSAPKESKPTSQQTGQ